MNNRWSPHVTVAAVIEQQNRFLLVEENINGANVFNQPAGHLEPDENLIDAIVRETLEETAWHFVPEALTGIYHWQVPNTSEVFLRFCFTGQAEQEDKNCELDPVIIAKHWLSLDEINKNQNRLRSPLVMKSIRDYINGQRYELDTLTHLI